MIETAADYDDGRFVSSEEPVAEVMGVPATHEFLAQLDKYGMHSVGGYDDFVTFTSGLEWSARGDSPIGRILKYSMADAGMDGDKLVQVFQKIVTDVHDEQFEKNWAEFL
jgi:hypothetical protein